MRVLDGLVQLLGHVVLGRVVLGHLVLHLVLVPAGVPRKPGMSRDDLIETNVKIVRSVSEKVAEHSPESIMILVSNPLDAMVYTAWKASGFPTNRIVGQAGCLDVARYRAFLAMKLGCSIEDISALLLGGHGDDMVPLPRYTSVHGTAVSAPHTGPIRVVFPFGNYD